MNKNKYLYPAIVSFDEDGISVEFPDLPGCYTCADTIDEATICAKDALGLHLYSMEQDGEHITPPSSINSISTNSNQTVMLIEVWMPLIRDIIENKAVKKTLTLPKWLNDAAEQEKVNFSQVLQSALKDHLGVSDNKTTVIKSK